VGHADYEKRWQKPGDETRTTIPSLDFPADPLRDIFYEFSSSNAQRADNIKLQDFRLSYQFLIGQKNISPPTRLEVFIYASNLGIIWKASKSGIDPDYYNTYLPPSKNFSIGIRANL
jgi:hypothetical protein